MARVFFYRESDRVPMLEIHGHRLRRPVADYLRDGIYELRVRRAGVRYRMLYFFHGREIAVVSHGTVKHQARVPPAEIDRALRHKWRFEADPQRQAFLPGR